MKPLKITQPSLPVNYKLVYITVSSAVNRISHALAGLFHKRGATDWYDGSRIVLGKKKKGEKCSFLCCSESSSIA